MSREENPASKPTPVQDVQGDGRWMSLVSVPTWDIEESWGRGAGVAQENGWFVPLPLPDWETESSWGGAA